MANENASENVEAIAGDDEQLDEGDALAEAGDSLDSLRTTLKDVIGRYGRDDPRYAAVSAAGLLRNEVLPLFEMVLDAVENLHDAVLELEEDHTALAESVGTAAQVGILVTKVQQLCAALRTPGCALNAGAATLLIEIETILAPPQPGS